MVAKILSSDEIHALIERRQCVVGMIGEVVALARDGSVFRGACPFHVDCGRCLIVSAEEQTFACRVCGAHGGAIEFLMRTNDVSAADAAAMFAALVTASSFQRSGLHLVGKV